MNAIRRPASARNGQEEIEGESADRAVEADAHSPHGYNTGLQHEGVYICVKVS
jgi:hypothetical protein